MALCCCGSRPTVKEFTLLLVYVLHVSHPAALEGTTRYAREIVDKFFSAHTSIDVNYIEAYNHKFLNLTTDSRLEIAFASRPRKYKVPNYRLYKYEHTEGLSVVFEVELRLIKRYIPSHCDYDLIEVESTEYVPLSVGGQRKAADMRVSYMNV